MLGIDLNRHFSAGLKTAFFDNFDSLSALETLLFFRYYLPLPKITNGPFAQMEAGGVIYLERGYHKYLEAFPSFSGGLSIGWRFNLGGHWYLEPAARGGYPHIWGFSVTAGVRFNGAGGNQTEVVIEQEKEIKEGEVIDDMKITRDDDDNLRLQMFSIMFRNNQADFTGLNDETVKNNYETIRHVAEFLNKYKNYRIIIEGHANPTTAEGRAREQERNTILRLSEQRAQKVMEILKEFGVSSDRMSVVGAGFSKMLAPYNDTENNWKNRRVEIILIRE
jgi:outer membrane protein OmpA-like peptidoglycan-associated protein